jgi:hypothetical protein
VSAVCRDRVDGGAADAHHELIRAPMAGDAPLARLDPAVELLQAVVGARQVRHVVAVVEPVPEPPQDRHQVGQGRLQPRGEVAGRQRSLDLLQLRLDLPAHLARLGAGRTIDGARERAGRVAAAVAEAGQVLGAGQELDRLGPDGVAEDQTGPTVRAAGQFGAVADVGQRAEVVRALHRRPPAPVGPPAGSARRPRGRGAGGAP